MARYSGASVAGSAGYIGMAALVVALAVAPAGASAATHHKSKGKASEQTQTTKADAPNQCGPTPERSSIGMRALQTELMVAGLKCSADQWNNFTAKFKTVIKTDADRLQKLFNKLYGKSGPTQMNAFVTQLANEASQRSNQSSEADYCRQQAVLFDRVLALTAQELEHFSVHRKLAVPTPVSLCLPEEEPPATVVAASAPVPAAAVATQPVPVAAKPSQTAQDDSPGFFGRLFR